MFQSAPEDWGRTTLGELVSRRGGSIQTGPFGSQLHASDYVPVGVPSIMPANIGDNRLIPDGIARITEADAERLSKHIVRRGDIIYSRRGDVERRALVREAEDGWFCGTGCLKIRLGEGVVLPEFASFYLGHPEVREWIVRHAVGATMPNLNTSIMAAVPFLLPPLAEQGSIADVLGSLDDKIEQNRRTGRALEKLARAIFRAWFVDFEPVHAKAAGATSFPSMPQDVFDALPAKLIDTPVGLVPGGWEVRPLSEAFEINPPRKLTKGQNAPYLDMKNMPTEGHVPASWNWRPYGSGMRFINGDTLVARITPCLENGKTAYVDFLSDGEVGWGSTEYIVLRPRPPLPEIFAYCLARTPGFREFAIQNMTGTSGRQRVAASALEHYCIAIPNEQAAAAFGQVLTPLFECIRAGQDESSKLASLRDYLLPRLLSGQVRVRDAEKWADDPEGFDVAEHQSAAAAKRTRVSVQCNLTGASDSQSGLGDDDHVQAGETRGDSVAVAEAGDEPPSMSIAGRPPVPIESWSTEEVMAAFRQAARNRGAMTREELLKRVAQRLGYQRLGSAIRERLKNHLRAALRRHIIAADGPEWVVAETTSMSDYELDELVDVLRSVMRKGQAMQREEVIRAVAAHLGFTRLVDTVQAPIKSAINAGIRRGILQYDRNTLWRVG